MKRILVIILAMAFFISAQNAYAPPTKYTIQADTTALKTAGIILLEYGRKIIPDTTVGKGRTVGDPTHRIEVWADTVNASIIRSSTQPAFAARPSLTLTDVTGAGTDYTVICNTEDVDQAGSHNTTTGIFTAPVAGVYLFTATVYLTGIAAGHTNGWMTFQTTSLAFYLFSGDPAAFDTSGELALSGSAITYLSANDTVTLHVYISGGTGVVDVHTPTRFSGTLLW